jgi:hypothetical protein
VSPELREEIELELAMLRQLIDHVSTLRKKVRVEGILDRVELELKCFLDSMDSKEG